METLVRCYRYALRPTPVQAQALAHASAQARRLWNEMVALLRWAEKEQRHGRREALIAEYGRILAGKALVGAAVTKARRIAAERGLANEAEAISIARAEAVEKVRTFGTRRLALAYARERVQANTKGKRLILSAQTVVAIVRKFGDACALYVTGKRGKPHFKTMGDTVSLQRQVSAGSSPVDWHADTVDLAGVLGSENCRAVRAILHRPLPAGATIKQLCVTQTATRSFVVLMIEAPAVAFARSVPESAAVAGIDPGRKTALSVSSLDGTHTETIQPPLFRDARFLRRLNRLQRKADRQLRAGNPERFDEKGRWKKRAGALKISNGLRQTRTRIAEGLRHIADARRETYHLAANRLLRDYGTVGVGNWRGRGKVLGVGKQKRGQNRKDYDNAIGGFVAILKDKASRCDHARRVVDVREAGTTKHCPDCQQPTGPSGLKDLKVRVWTCSHCGQTHQRDFASARAIAARAVSETAAGAHPAQREPVNRQARIPAATLTKVRLTRKVGAKSPLSLNERPKESERRSAVSVAKTPRGAAAAGVEVVAKPAPCSQPAAHQQMDLPLAFADAALSRTGGCVGSRATGA